MDKMEGRGVVKQRVKWNGENELQLTFHKGGLETYLYGNTRVLRKDPKDVVEWNAGRSGAP